MKEDKLSVTNVVNGGNQAPHDQLGYQNVKEAENAPSPREDGCAMAVLLGCSEDEVRRETVKEWSAGGSEGETRLQAAMGHVEGETLFFTTMGHSAECVDCRR